MVFCVGGITAGCCSMLVRCGAWRRSWAWATRAFSSKCMYGGGCMCVAYHVLDDPPWGADPEFTKLTMPALSPTMTKGPPGRSG